MQKTVSLSNIRRDRELELLIKEINRLRINNSTIIPQNLSITRETLNFLMVDEKEQIIHFELRGLEGIIFEISNFIPTENVRSKTIKHTQKILEWDNIVDLWDYRVEKPEELKKTAIFCLRDLFWKNISIDLSEIQILREEKNRLYFIYNWKNYNVETLSTEIFELIRNTFPKKVKKWYWNSIENLFTIKDVKLIDPWTGENYFIEFFSEGSFYRAITKNYEELDKIGRSILAWLKRAKIRIVSDKKS